MRDRAVVLASRPSGIAQSEHFRIVDRDCPEPSEGQVLIKNHYLAVEPAMRGWIADTGNYSPPVAIGATMRSLTVGRIVSSRHPDWRVGDVVTGWFGWQEHAAVAPDAILRRVMESDLPQSLALGILGINGITAYLALTMIGQPRAGETVLVSTAAGGVGSAAGQIARRLGCRTVGITGSEDKVALCLDRYGYDAAINYRTDKLDEEIAAATPDGVDVYYDNTAGPISDSVMRNLSTGARVVICGTSAIADWNDWPQGPRVERHLLVKRARMEGFVIFDHMDRWDATVATLADWVRDGSLLYDEDILDGIEAAPDALAGIYRGENLGRRLIRLPE